jgi:hypothetical protein
MRTYLRPKCFGHALAQAGLADTGGAEQANDRRFHVAFQLQHGEVLDQALLHFFQAEMIAVEDFLRGFQVEFVFGEFAPRKLQQQAAHSCIAH